MRTKALLLAAVFGVAGLATSFAQVYSVNAVGYINLTLQPGFTMIANQLDNKAGNTVTDVLKGLPDGTLVYKWTDTGYVINTWEGGEWDPSPNMTLAPGEGAFIRIPAGAPVTVTLVGEVPQGTLNVPLRSGFTIASSAVPQGANLADAGMSFPAVDGDLVYRWTNPTGYSIFTFEAGEWDPPIPTFAVGESFFVRTGTARSWTRTFDVNTP